MAAIEKPLVLNFDPNELTLGQMEQLEEATGIELGVLAAQMQEGKFSAKVLKAIVFMLMSAQDPDFTIEDAANIKIGVVASAVGVPLDPPEAAVDAAVPAASNGR